MRKHPNEVFYKEITLFRRMKEQALAVKVNQYLPAEKHLYLLLSFYDTLSYYYIYQNSLALCSGSPAPSEVFLRLTIITENDNDIIVYGFETIIAFAWNNQFIFFAHCVWWLASITGLE